MTELVITKTVLILALLATIAKYSNLETGMVEAPLWVYLIFAIGFLRLLYLGFRERIRGHSRHD